MEASIYDVVNYRILFSIQLIGSQTIIRKWNIKKKKGNIKILHNGVIYEYARINSCNGISKT